MTIEEKLKHFQDICMEDARDRSSRMLDDYMKALEKTFEEHKQAERKNADLQVKLETEKLEREINKKLSIEQLDLRREAGHRQDELKDKLFVELKDYLANFMETEEYEKFLERQVHWVKDFAGDEAFTIYMDPSDAERARRISLYMGVAIRISDYSFLGGIRAVIPGRHILIDNSFQTRLEEARHNFRFTVQEAGETGSEAGRSTSSKGGNGGE